MKNNPFFLLAVSLLASVNGMAQKVTEDHLVPVEGNFTMYNYQYEHYANIRSVLLKGLNEMPEARFLVKPSFESEYVLQVENDTQRGKFAIVVQRAKESIWTTEDKSKIKMDTWRNILSGSDVDVIVSLFRQAIAGVKYPEVRSVKKYDDTDSDGISFVQIFDGETYFFSYNDHYPIDQRTGMTKSPDIATRMGRLVDVAIKLTELAKSDKGTVVLPDELKRTMVNLTNELKNSAR